MKETVKFRNGIIILIFKWRTIMPALEWLVHHLCSNFRNKAAGFEIVANCMKTGFFSVNCNYTVGFDFQETYFNNTPHKL